MFPVCYVTQLLYTSRSRTVTVYAYHNEGNTNIIVMSTTLFSHFMERHYISTTPFSSGKVKEFIDVIIANYFGNEG